MSINALETVIVAEKQADMKLAAASSEAKIILAEAEANGNQMIMMAEAEAEEAVEVMLEESELKAAQAVQDILSRTSAECSVLRSSSQSKMSRAVQLVRERIVNA